MKFNDIRPYTRAGYQTNVSLDFLLDSLERYRTEHRLNTDPDFQRAHVWTEAQQIAFVEYILRDGRSGRDIYFNHPGWMRDFNGEFVLVDGKQRLEALRRFLENEIPAFGYYISEFEDYIPFTLSLTFHVNNLPTRAAVLQWYIDMNRGGTVHTDEEIERVKALLEQEME